MSDCLGHDPEARASCTELLSGAYFDGFHEWWGPEFKRLCEKDQVNLRGRFKRRQKKSSSHGSSSSSSSSHNNNNNNNANNANGYGGNSKYGSSSSSSSHQHEQQSGNKRPRIYLRCTAISPRWY